MTTITLPPEIEKPLVEQARQQGTTPEMLALDGLRRLFAPAEAEDEPPSETLFDFLQSRITPVDGTSEALSENCGERFTESLLEKLKAGK
ncbi:MAG: hypothetical protein M3Y13_11755 [Armatimonadota bacterium]|nr:hypothetical protein [Armatimonadota bacterium]